MLDSYEERLKVMYGLGCSEPTRFVHIDPITGDVTSQPLNIDKELTKLEAIVTPDITVGF